MEAIEIKFCGEISTLKKITNSNRLDFEVIKEKDSDFIINVYGLKSELIDFLESSCYLTDKDGTYNSYFIGKQAIGI